MSGTSPRATAQATTNATEFVGLELGEGRYRVQSKLGEGSMGVVYLGFDNRLETEVVIKVPTAATLNDPEFAERFQRETRSLVKLKHPHIVTIHDVGVIDGIPYVVMQFLSGGSLRDRIVDDSGRVKAQPLERLKDWLPAMGRALDFIHKQGFLHRDVKPANILFDEHGNAFLADFGLAKAVNSAAAGAKRDQSLTAAGFLVGTPNYVAPELVMGHEHDGKVDQYSLAMTAYETLAGCVPVEGPTASATMVNQTSMKIPPISQFINGFPEPVSEVLLRGLSKNQKKRFETCEQFVDAVLVAMAPPVVRQSQQSQATIPAGKVARAVSPGRIPCPECGKVLPLKPQFAGKRARCGQCLHLLLIGNDLNTLRIVGGPPAPRIDEEELAEAPVTNRNRKSARDTTRNESGQTSRNRLNQDSEIGELLGEEVFGLKLTPKIAIILAFVLIMLLVTTAGVIVYVKGRQELDKVKKDAAVNKVRDNEKQVQQQNRE